MSQPEKYTVEKITEIHAWTPHLFSFKLTRFTGYRFVPGQFARLGLRKEDGSIVWRAYSIVSASYDDYLEFFSIVVPGGEFTSRLSKLTVGDEVLVEKMNYGFLTTARFEQGRDLWMLATGTGVAPFISILHELDTWESYDRIVLVYSVRHANELAYEDTVAAFEAHEYFGEFAGKLTFVPVVTREKVSGILTERIPVLLENGELERGVGVKLDHERSRIMICGNPEMVDDTRAWFIDNGYTISRRAKPGHLALENLW
ncbi:MAG: ferredoxin--NADP reductase [Burkholderiales bacterium]|nr:ferredoxin--NADP reductase [Burkholderiales bacterium]